MKKYCPDAKKKSGESEDSGPKDDCAVGMIAFQDNNAMKTFEKE